MTVVPTDAWPRGGTKGTRVPPPSWVARCPAVSSPLRGWPTGWNGSRPRRVVAKEVPPSNFSFKAAPRRGRPQRLTVWKEASFAGGPLRTGGPLGRREGHRVTCGRGPSCQRMWNPLARRGTRGVQRRGHDGGGGVGGSRARATASGAQRHSRRCRPRSRRYQRACRVTVGALRRDRGTYRVARRVPRPHLPPRPRWMMGCPPPPTPAHMGLAAPRWRVPAQGSRRRRPGRAGHLRGRTATAHRLVASPPPPSSPLISRLGFPRPHCEAGPVGEGGGRMAPTCSTVAGLAIAG